MDDTSGGAPESAPPLPEPPLEQPMSMATGMAAASQYPSLLMRMIPSLSLPMSVCRRWSQCGGFTTMLREISDFRIDEYQIDVRLNNRLVPLAGKVVL